MTDFTERRLLRLAAEEGLAGPTARRLVRHVIESVTTEEQEEYIRFAARLRRDGPTIILGHDGRYGTSASGVEPPDIKPENL
jgi:hypothetical protein